MGDSYKETFIGKTLRTNKEISVEILNRDGSIMYSHGIVYSNDIEMVLEAFRTNKKQHAFNPTSKVIRLPQIFE